MPRTVSKASFRQALKGNTWNIPLKLINGSILLVFKVILIAAVFCMTIILAGYRQGVTVGMFTHDIHHIAHLPFYTGIISNTGIVLWSSCAAICFFSFLWIRNTGKQQSSSGFFLYSGILTLLLMFDDLIMLHEVILPYYVGIDEKIFFGVYGLLFLRFLYLYKNIILQSNYIYLIAAFGALGFSVIIDIMPFHVPARLIFEDVPKFIGICCWLLYFGDTSLRRMSAGNSVT